MPIDGLVSGLDTDTIITQLMAAERKPVDLLTARQTSAQAAVDAYKSIESKFSAIATASAALERSSGWDIRSTTSSDATVATATAADGATIGGLQFTVDRLATTHGVATTATTATTSDIVAGSGTVQITVGGTAHDIPVGSGSLTEVANAINSAGLGVKAAIVNTGNGYRLQMTATSSGAAGVFSVTGGLGATAVTTDGVDAKLTFGSGPGAYDVTSSTNVFSNVLPGVTVTAKATSATPVTIDVKSDVDGLTAKVKALVDAVNGALTEIKTRTAYDPSSQKAASLAGDTTARRATQALTLALSDAIAQSPLGSPGLAGVSLDRNGMATFDATKFQAAYANDPDAVERLFVQGATTTGSVQFVSAGPGATTGARSVVVTLAATQATQVGMAGAFPLTVPATIRIKMGTTEIVYPAGPPQTQAEVKDGLQAAIDNAGFQLTVSTNGTGLQVQANNYGSKGSFDIDWGTGSYTSATAVDAQGTIDGVTATGVGRQLSIPSTDGPLSGLSVLLTSDATGAVGTVNYEPGLAQRISSAVAAATNSSTGYLTTAESSKSSEVSRYQTDIDAYNVRLTTREARLRSQFAQLEVTLNTLKQQSSSLAAQLGGLTANSDS